MSRPLPPVTPELTERLSWAGISGTARHYRVPVADLAAHLHRLGIDHPSIGPYLPTPGLSGVTVKDYAVAVRPGPVVLKDITVGTAPPRTQPAPSRVPPPARPAAVTAQRALLDALRTLGPARASELAAVARISVASAFAHLSELRRTGAVVLKGALYALP